ncbi:HNH endonuclease [Bdellovibrio sp. SKB1291214]|uniref:HNH endonuclease n=1 Tax=Bdellovibrio sp. SKB1291214 TaxID=1732569 RepID=UPI000B51754C|nr:HNH endonuclease signature motif containing protein [Bdellovibrio sp. SKB1291214]UYL08533.1 HNH endonuclease [Bdellovibrio sp. SKB1291214]
MDLTQVANAEILNRVEKLARTERKITHLILWHLVEVESRRLYLELGYTSLFKYMTGHLNYSEDAAYRRVQAARLLKKVPQVDKLIESGDLNLTQMTHVQKCLNKELEQGNCISVEKTEEVLALVQNKTSFETKKILAVEFNQPIRAHEVILPQKDESVRMEITFSSEQMEGLEHAKELLSHVLPNPTWADLISYLAETQIQKRRGKSRNTDFIEKNEIAEYSIRETRAVGEVETNDEVVIEVEANTAGASVESVGKVEGANAKTVVADKVIVKGAGARRAIKITTRRKLLANSMGQCEFVHDNFGRCTSKFQLQVDHKIPLAFGGTNDFSNLRILCGVHNRAEAQRLGILKH